MEIRVAKTSGFCFGVKRAIELLDKEIEKGTSPIYTLGPIIHNEHVVSDYKEKGVVPVETIDEGKNGILIIRTHGISEKMYRQIEESGIQYIDVTCPFVKKIHKIVSEHYKKGYAILVIGDAKHPEVIGINGWCDNSAVVIDDESQVDGLDPDKPYCLVAQTTFKKTDYDNIVTKIKSYCKDTVIFDTICSATEERQKEAEEIAKSVDTMLVFGGEHSSNTRKLFQICKNLCDNTYHISSNKIPGDIKVGSKLGITAGASTPQWIIKEAIKTMEEREKMLGTSEETELDFAEAVEQSMRPLKSGDVVKGTVIEVRETEVIVNLGTKADGFIPGGEVSSNPDARPSDVVSAGDVIDVFVVRVNDAEGNIMLSKKKLDYIKDMQEIKDALESKAVITGKVVDIVNGGVIVLVKGTRIFVPASQASDRFLSDLEVLRGQTVDLRIIDINDRRRKIVGSIRQVMEERKAEAGEKFWGEAEVGKVYVGKAKSITDFGVFVDIGGIDGLVHVSELSWKRIKHPSDVVKVGDTMEVYIKELDKEKNKISLGFKKVEDNPWEIAKSKLAVGEVVQCKIVRLVNFGAFAEIISGIDGLIHISQIANKRVEKPADELEVGQYVQAKITAIDWENKKISLSIRALIEEDEKEKAEKEAAEALTAPASEVVYSEDTSSTIGDALGITTEETEQEESAVPAEAATEPVAEEEAQAE